VCTLSSSVHCTKHLDHDPASLILPEQQPPRAEFQVTPLDPLEAAFRHSGWSVRRRLVWDALRRTHQSPNRLDRFAQCGSACVVEWSKTLQTARLRANFCRDRLCVPCGRARSRQVANALIKESTGRTVRFATFTLRHSRTPLRDQIDRLYRSFSALRRRAWFKSNTAGGVAVLETKIGIDGLWHVHLHTLLVGQYLDQKTLSEEWHAVTGDSYIVDVRRIDGDHGAIKYVAAYVGKPMDATVTQHAEALDEFVIAIRGRRVVNTWGCWSRLDLDPDTSETATDWLPVASLRQLINDARGGDRFAQAMLLSLSSERDRNAGKHPSPTLWDDSA